MSKFIEVYGRINSGNDDGITYLINPLHIIYLHDENGKAIIFLSNGKAFYTNSSLEEIHSLLDACK